MKKLSLLLLTLTVCFFTACHKDIWAELENLDQRVTKLEELCKEMNTNITSLQTIVDVLQSNDFITNIVEIKKDGKVVGYTITFGKHDPITIYHGQNGKDGQNGQNGADGKDGITPVIGVAQDTDGVYYWTLNGEWLLDDNGKKLPVSGKDGVNGTDGKDGQDGADGKDGITPLLKIENGYWYISYDNGATWTESGKATGDNGQNGKNGTDGKDGQDGVTPLLKIENGYWYISYDNGATWAQLGKATGEDGKDGANGTNGTDGKDGQDGADGADGSNGQDGITPQLKIENGYWYVSYDNGATWTQFGKASGADGQDGQNGTDGKDGKDGVTPQLKIEEGYWYISYDNGATWTQLGKATGEDGKDGTDGEDGKDGADGEDGKDGQNGADGKDGQDGDSMFQSVTQDENYVYFTLADGTMIKIAKGSGNNQSNDDFIFTITYNPNGGEGVMKKDTFYYGYPITIKSCAYTKEGYFCKYWNTNPNGSGVKYQQGFELTIDRNIILYAQWKENAWEAVDLGLSVKWASMNIGAESPEDYGFYFAWGEIEPKCIFSEYTYKWCQTSVTSNLTKYNYRGIYGTTDGKTVLETADDAAYVNWGENWRIPTRGEADELTKNCTWVLTSRNGVEGYEVTSKKNSNSIFLPLAGRYLNDEYELEGIYGYFWLNSISLNSNSLETDGKPYQAFCIRLTKTGRDPSYLQTRHVGLSVRPVCP